MKAFFRYFCTDNQLLMSMAPMFTPSISHEPNAIPGKIYVPSGQAWKAEDTELVSTEHRGTTNTHCPQAVERIDLVRGIGGARLHNAAFNPISCHASTAISVFLQSLADDKLICHFYIGQDCG